MSTGFDPLYEWLGIPPDEQPPHCYRLLGVRAFETNIQTIESAADRHTIYLQTLLSGPHGDLAQELLNQIGTARSWLLTPENKVQYDAWLTQQLGVNAAPPVVQAAPPVVEAAPEAAESEPIPDLSEALGTSDDYVPSSRSGPRNRKRQSMGMAISITAGVLALAAAGAAVYFLQNMASDTGNLVIQWPEDQRSGGVLEVDGKRVAMSSGAEIVCSLPMGPHAVKCTRPGYEPFEVTMGVTTGMATRVQPEWREVGAKPDDAKPDASDKPGAPAANEAGAKQEKADDFMLDAKAEPKAAK